jgi:heme oxygenase (mycobilin-producing)
MFVALSKFLIANDMTPAVKQAFRNRPHTVESVAGFVRLEVLSPEARSEEIWLITYWTSREAFECWHRSDDYKHSHLGIPKGLKLVPKQTTLTFFEHVSS